MPGKVAVSVLFAAALAAASFPQVLAVPHSNYAGFASPEAGYSLNSRSISFATDGGQNVLSLSASDYAVYRYAYVSLDGQAWKPVALSGNALGGLWLNGSVTGQVSFDAANFSLTQSRLSTGRNFIVVYSCSRSGNAWDCHSGWQIWQFNASLEESDSCEGIDCDDSEPCTTDSCSDGVCFHSDVTSCASGDSCCPSGCTYPGDSDCESLQVLDVVDVIGPHEFWTHTNAQNGDDAGQVEFSDLDDFVPAFSIESGNDGAFAIGASTGKITVADSGSLSPGEVYTLGVRISDPGMKESIADVIIHVADGPGVVYFDGNATDGGDGSYARPYNSLSDHAGAFDRGVHLLRRGTVFHGGISIQDTASSPSNPIVVGAYGKGPKPAVDGSREGYTSGISIGRWDDRETLAFGYVHVQNLEVRNFDASCIVKTQSMLAHNITIMDLEIHDCALDKTTHPDWDAYSFYIWPKEPESDMLLDIKIVNCESYRANGGGKIYAAGTQIINYYSHDHPTGSGIRAVDGRNVTIRGGEFSNNGQFGMQLRARFVTAEYVDVHGNGQHGIYFYNDSGVPCGDMVLRHGRSYNNGQKGITAEWCCPDVTIEDMKVYGNTEEGIGLRNMIDTAVVRDSEIYENGAEGISLKPRWPYESVPMRNIILENNSVHDNALYGIYVSSVRGIGILGNTIHGNGAGALSVQPSAYDVTQQGNVIY